MKKYENKQVDGKVNKENKDTTRNLCFHDWLIVRELKVLDDAYDDMLKQVNYRVLNLCDIEDSDERQQEYDKILEERETLRAIYIQRRNELKAGFTDRQEKEVSEKGWKKSRMERLSDVARGGYVLSEKETKAALNKRFGCIDESAEFEGDLITEIVLDEGDMSKKPDVKVIYDESAAAKVKGLRELVNPIDEVGPEDYVNTDSWHKYTPEELEEKGIVKGTLAKGRLHPDDTGKELTPEMLNRVIWENAEDDE